MDSTTYVIAFILGLWPIGFTLLMGIPIWMKYHRGDDPQSGRRAFFNLNKLGVVATFVMEVVLLGGTYIS